MNSKPVFAFMAVAFATSAGWNLPVRAADTAQTPFAAAPVPANPPRVNHQRPEGVLEFADQLGLTDDQKTKIQALYSTQAAQLDALKNDTTTDPKALEQQKRAIRKTANDAVLQVLTADQQKQFRQINAQRDAAKIMKSMTADLTLTTDEQTKIQPIVADMSAKLQDLNADQTLVGKERRAKAEAIRSDASAQIKPLLAPDQALRLDDFFASLGKRKPKPAAVPPATPTAAGAPAAG